MENLWSFFVIIIYAQCEYHNIKYIFYFEYLVYVESILSLIVSFKKRKCFDHCFNKKKPKTDPNKICLLLHWLVRNLKDK